MGYVTYYGSKHGDFEKLVAPLDGDKNFCGYDPGFEEYNKLYISDMSDSTNFKAIFNSAVCVKTCPKIEDEAADCKTTSHVPSCTFKPENKYDSKASGLGFCIPVSIDALPSNFKEGWKNAMEVFKGSSVGQYFNDLYLSSRAIYWSMAMGFVYCFVYIYLMSAFAETIAWICVALIQLGLLLGSIGLFWYRSEYLADHPETADFQYEGEPETWSSEERAANQVLTNANGFLVGGIFFGVAALIFCCCVYCGFRSLKLAIDVIDASADFLAGTKRIILVPILYFFLTVVVVLIWAGAMAQVVSMNDIEAGDGI